MALRTRIQICAALLVIAWLPACTGLGSEERMYGDSEAEALILSLWGPEAKGLQFDTERELLAEEVAMVEEEEGAAEKKYIDLDLGLAGLSTAPFPELIAELQRLRPGRTMSVCETWTRVETEGTNTRRYVEIPESPVRFLVLARGDDEVLRGKIQQAPDHDEARAAFALQEKGPR